MLPYWLWELIPLVKCFISRKLCYWQKFYREILEYRFVTTVQHNTQDPTMHMTLNWNIHTSAQLLLLPRTCLVTSADFSVRHHQVEVCLPSAMCVPRAYTSPSLTHTLPFTFSLIKSLWRPSISPYHLSFPHTPAHKTELFLLTFIPLMRNPCWFIIQWYKSLHSQADISIILQTAALGYSNLLQTGLQAEERHVSQYQT